MTIRPPLIREAPVKENPIISQEEGKEKRTSNVFLHNYNYAPADTSKGNLYPKGKGSIFF